MTTPNQKYTITKKIAKHGSQSVIVIPSVLRDKIKPQTLVKIQIEILDGGQSK